MRWIVALLAVIGLLASPAVAAAAQAACHGDPAAMTMSMPMSVTGHADAAAMACCGGKAKQPRRPRDINCVQSCSAMCGVIAALPASPVLLTPAPLSSGLRPLAAASLTPHPPPGLERPPRPIV